MKPTPEEILAQLDRTEDGEYITPQTNLWQIDPKGKISGGSAWRVDRSWSFQKRDGYLLFSSEAAALRSVRSASETAAEDMKSLVSTLAELLTVVTSAGHWSNDGESYTMYGDTYHPSLIESIVEQLQCVDDLLHDEGHVSLAKQVPGRTVRVEPEIDPAIRKTPFATLLPAGWHNEADTQRIKDLESHVVGLQMKAESDLKIIEQQKRVITKQRNRVITKHDSEDAYELICWAARREVSLTCGLRFPHVMHSAQDMVLTLETENTAFTHLVKRNDNSSLGVLFEDAMRHLKDQCEGSSA